MNNKITTGYSELQILFKELGVQFRDSGPAEDNLGKRVNIVLFGEDHDSTNSVSLLFKIDKDGSETFVGQD